MTKPKIFAIKGKWYFCGILSTIGKPASWEEYWVYVVQLKTNSSAMGPRQMERKTTSTIDSSQNYLNLMIWREILESERMQTRNRKNYSWKLSDISIKGKAIKNELEDKDLEIQEVA
jgi:hypothetical protein